MSRKKRDRQRREKKLAKAAAELCDQCGKPLGDHIRRVMTSDPSTERCEISLLPNGKIGNAVYVEVPMPDRQ